MKIQFVQIYIIIQKIIAIGFKVDNERFIQFIKWANQIVKNYTIKGWVIDDERLKNGGYILTENSIKKVKCL